MTKIELLNYYKELLNNINKKEYVVYGICVEMLYLKYTNYYHHDELYDDFFNRVNWFRKHIISIIHGRYFWKIGNKNQELNF